MKNVTRRDILKAIASAGILSVVIIFFISCSSGGSGSTGHSLYYEGEMKEREGAYISANALYSQALPLLRQENDPAMVRDARQAVKRTGIVISDFSATEKDIRNTFAEKFSGVSEDQIKYLISRVAYLDIEGTRYFYNDFINTVYNIDLSLMKQLPEEMARNRKGYAALEPFVSKAGPTSGTPYINPVTYEATATYNVPRNELPQTGILKIWQPVPITTDCQTGVTMVSVTPESYAKTPASIQGNLGDVYLEVPLESLTGDMQIEIKFRFAHFEQRFTMIDPNNVGVYDKESPLYKEFTAPGKNISITPEIAAKAHAVAGGEQNPYFAARKIYDYVVDDLTYSHMPHGSLEWLKLPESVTVHSNRYGDCGAQSIYFAALCRAIGIPARATGGYQLFPGMEGTHFWAEFYLPNYGWVPVDTSVAQVSKYLPELTDKQKKAFKDYFFGSMDPYRWVIQKDVDLPFSPPVPEPTAISMILQTPAVLCDTMDEVPEQAIWSHYRIQFTRTP